MKQDLSGVLPQFLCECKFHKSPLYFPLTTNSTCVSTVLYLYNKQYSSGQAVPEPKGQFHLQTSPLSNQTTHSVLSWGSSHQNSLSRLSNLSFIYGAKTFSLALCSDVTFSLMHHKQIAFFLPHLFSPFPCCLSSILHPLLFDSSQQLILCLSLQSWSSLIPRQVCSQKNFPQDCAEILPFLQLPCCFIHLGMQ